MRRGSGLTGVVVVYLIVIHGIWVNRVTLTLPAGRGSWVGGITGAPRWSGYVDSQH